MVKGKGRAKAANFVSIKSGSPVSPVRFTLQWREGTAQHRLRHCIDAQFSMMQTELMPLVQDYKNQMQDKSWLGYLLAGPPKIRGSGRAK